MSELAFVCFLWRPRDRRGLPPYGREHVNRLARQLDRYAPAHRLVCVTDDPAGLDDGIVALPAEEDLLAAGRRYPKLSFYRRDGAAFFGARRLVLIDLDCLIIDRLEPILDRQERIVCWPDPNWGKTPYNSSLVLMDAGAFPRVREEFAGSASDLAVRQSRFMGSDQAWLAMVLGRDLPVWRAGSGVLSYRRDCAHAGRHSAGRIIFFAGHPKPWDPQTRALHPWIVANEIDAAERLSA